MKKSEIDKQLNGISKKLDVSSGGSITRIDPECFTEQERALFAKVAENKVKYRSDLPLPETFSEDFELASKGVEIIVRRAVELFVRVMPHLFWDDQVATWFFNQFFHNFLLDYAECLKFVYKRSEKERQDLLSYLEENGKLSAVYRIRPFDPTTFGMWAISLGRDDKPLKNKKRGKRGKEKQ